MFRPKPWQPVILLAVLLMIPYVLEYRRMEMAQDEAIELDTIEAKERYEAKAAPKKDKKGIIFQPFSSVVPDFSSIYDINEKKKAFLDYFYPIIIEENNKILAERKILLSNDKNSAAVKRLCMKYSADCDHITAEQRNLLIKRIDVVPPALALAQAAKESGWGTSRFAVEANNYFGQWCYQKGCGLVPSNRLEGANHEVRKFDSPQHSVRSYLFNLNTGRAYADFRLMRLAARDEKREFTGHELAKSLLYYSERREAYVEEVQSLIRYNQLSAYDDAFWQLVAL